MARKNHHQQPPSHVWTMDFSRSPPPQMRRTPNDSSHPAESLSTAATASDHPLGMLSSFIGIPNLVNMSAVSASTSAPSVSIGLHQQHQHQHHQHQLHHQHHQHQHQQHQEQQHQADMLDKLKALKTDFRDHTADMSAAMTMTPTVVPAMAGSAAANDYGQQPLGSSSNGLDRSLASAMPMGSAVHLNGHFSFTPPGAVSLAIKEQNNLHNSVAVVGAGGHNNLDHIDDGILGQKKPVYAIRNVASSAVATCSNSSTSSETSNSSQHNNNNNNNNNNNGWSFEEQFKQVRQLYELTDEPERKHFLDEMFSFMQKRGTPVNRLPIMAKHVLDLFQLFNLVIARGGLVEVINKKLWQEIIKGLKLPSSITSAAFTLRTQYMKYLFPYECHMLNLSNEEELKIAIDGNKREGRRNGFQAAQLEKSIAAAKAAVNSPALFVSSMHQQHQQHAAAVAAQHQQVHQQQQQQQQFAQYQLQQLQIQQQLQQHQHLQQQQLHQLQQQQQQQQPQMPLAGPDPPIATMVKLAQLNPMMFGGTMPDGSSVTPEYRRLFLEYLNKTQANDLPGIQEAAAQIAGASSSTSATEPAGPMNGGPAAGIRPDPLVVNGGASTSAAADLVEADRLANWSQSVANISPPVSEKTNSPPQPAEPQSEALNLCDTLSGRNSTTPPMAPKREAASQTNGSHEPPAKRQLMTDLSSAGEDAYVPQQPAHNAPMSAAAFQPLAQIAPKLESPEAGATNGHQPNANSGAQAMHIPVPQFSPALMQVFAAATFASMPPSQIQSLQNNLLAQHLQRQQQQQQQQQQTLPPNPYIWMQHLHMQQNQRQNRPVEPEWEEEDEDDDINDNDNYLAGAHGNGERVLPGALAAPIAQMGVATNRMPGNRNGSFCYSLDGNEHEGSIQFKISERDERVTVALEMNGRQYEGILVERTAAASRSRSPQPSPRRSSPMRSSSGHRRRAAAAATDEAMPTVPICVANPSADGAQNAAADPVREDEDMQPTDLSLTSGSRANSASPLSATTTASMVSGNGNANNGGGEQRSNSAEEKDSARCSLPM